MHEKSLNQVLRLSSSAVDTCSELSMYHRLLDFAYDSVDGDAEGTQLLLDIYGRKGHPLISELQEILQRLHEYARLLSDSHLTDRAQKYLDQLQDIPAVAVTVHDTDPAKGFYYLDVHAPIPERLNTARNQVIGRPVRYLPKEISEPREHYIKRALANGQWERYSYEYQDEYRWKFNVTVVPLPGTEEILTVVQDAEPWQLGCWLNRLNRKNHDPH